MLVLPTVLELENLSDHELMERITVATEAIKAAKAPYGGDSDEQQLYRSLITDHNRREAMAATSNHNPSAV